MSEDLLTTREVAALLPAHRSTVAHWIKNGVLEAVRLGGQRPIYRVKASTLAAIRAGGRCQKASDDRREARRES